MPESTIKTIRVPADLLAAVDMSRGDQRFSSWALNAFRASLEDGQGLGSDYREQLTAATLQLIAIGRNLNQLARSANSGRPVTLSLHLVNGLLDHVRAVQRQIERVEKKLP